MAKASRATNVYFVVLARCPCCTVPPWKSAAATVSASTLCYPPHHTQPAHLKWPHVSNSRSQLDSTEVGATTKMGAPVRS